MNYIYVSVYLLISTPIFAQNLSTAIVDICIKQNTSIVLEGFTYSDHVDDEANKLVFKVDAKEAQKIIESFNISTLTHHKEFSHKLNYLTKCDKKKVEQLAEDQDYLLSCRSLYDEYRFFKALIYALKNYSWEKKLKVIATQKLVEYLKYLNSQSSHIDHQYLSLKLLVDMGKRELIDEKLLKKANKILKKIHKDRRKFNRQNELDYQKLSCLDIKNIINTEGQLSGTYRKDILTLLKE